MEDAGKGNWIAVLVLSGAVALLVGADLVHDAMSGSSSPHLILEGILLAVSGAAFILGILKLTRATAEIQTLRGNLQHLESERDRWRQESHQLLEGLSVKIEQQFAEWKLTQAEMEVGFLLLKGFSLKEIADIRNTKLKTVQQQSQSIYQKTGLNNRSALAAFFLEDLLPPGQQSSRPS